MPNQRLHRLIAELQSLFDRDLLRLKSELEAFTSDDLLWKDRDGISNSAGNLILHLCGNLRHFVGHIIGQTDYVRQRSAEFERTNVPKAKLLALIEATRQEVGMALQSMDAQLLEQPYPIEVFGNPMTHQYFLVHLSGHLNYHLGQINYFRRMN